MEQVSESDNRTVMIWVSHRLTQLRVTRLLQSAILLRLYHVTMVHHCCVAQW